MKHKHFRPIWNQRFRLKTGLLVPLALFLLTAATHAPALGDTSTVFLVRHAEKILDVTNPRLSPDGLIRAHKLAAVLTDAGIGQIHSTDFHRTRETGAPLAQKLGLDVTLYDPNNPQQLVTRLRAGGKHLVIGHSNTIPELVELLGGEGGAAINEPHEYDRLYVVTLIPDKQASSALLRYGKPFKP